MNRLLKIFLGTAVVFVMLLIIIAAAAIIFFPGERIKTIVEKQASSALGMKVSIGSIGLSFTGLPAVKITGFSAGPAYMEEPPLLAVKSVRARVDLTSLLKKSIEIVSVEINEPEVNLIIRKDGSSNLPQTSGNAEAESGPFVLPFPISMRSFSIENGRITVDNREAGVLISLRDISYRLSTEISKDLKIDSAEGKLRAENVSFLAGEEEKNALIEGLGMSLVHSLHGDLNTGDFKLAKGDILIGDMPVSVTADIAGFTKIAFSVSAGKHSAEKLLELIPVTLFPEKGKITADGTYSFSMRGTIDTEPEEPELSFEGSLAVDSMSLSYAGLPKSIDKIDCRINFTEKDLNLNEIGILIGGSTISLSGKVSDYLETPVMSISAYGSIDLKEVTDAFPMPEGSEYMGTVTFRIEAEGQASEPENARINGRIKLDSVETVMQETLRHPAKINGNITIAPKRISIDRLTMKTGVSDVSFSGAISGYKALILPQEGDEANFRGSISSKMLDMNDMLVTAREDEKTASAEPVNLEDMLRALPVPPNLNIDTGISLGRVIFGKLAADSVKGTVTVSKGSMKLNGLDIRAYSGSLTGEAAMTIGDDDIAYDGSFKLDRLDAGAFISSFFGIGEDIFGGSLSSSLSFGGAGLDSVSMLKNLNALGSFSMDNGRITNWDFTRKLGKTISFLDFDTLDFDRITASFSVADERIVTDDLKAKTEYGAFTVAGDTGFDTSVDYDIVFRLNKKAAALAKKNNLGLLSELFEDDSGTPVLRMKASGNLKSPKFKIDTSQVKEKAKEKLKKEAEKLLGEEADKLGKDLKKKGEKLLKKLFE